MTFINVLAQNSLAGLSVGRTSDTLIKCNSVKVGSFRTKFDPQFQMLYSYTVFYLLLSSMVCILAGSAHPSNTTIGIISLSFNTAIPFIKSLT